MDFGEWLEGKLKFTLATLGILGTVYLGYKIFKGSSKKSSYQHRYPTLPEKCKCSVCGYIIENPNKHCREIEYCPKCGAKKPFYRVK